MQLKLVLNPNYSGPVVIEEYMKKEKSKSSLARILSSYNRRYFMLDLSEATLCYTQEKTSTTQIANVKNKIFLDTSTQISVEKDIQKGSLQKQYICIRTKKKAYKILPESHEIMEKFLFGFSNLINETSGAPLFDWESYKSTNLSYIISNPRPSGFTNSILRASAMPSNFLSEKQEIIEREPFPVNNDIKSGVQDPDVLVSFRPMAKEIHLEHLNSDVNAFGHHAVASDRNSKPEKSNGTKELNEGGPREPFVLNSYLKEESKDVGSSYINRLSIEMSESSRTGAYHPPQLSVNQKYMTHRKSLYQNRAEEQRAHVHSSEITYKEEIRSSQAGNMNNTSQIRIEPPIEEKSNFLGSNRDVSQDRKLKSGYNIEEDEIPKRKDVLRHTKVGKNNDEKYKLNIGNGVVISLPRFEDAYENQDLPISYINMMEEAKKCSMIVMQGRLGERRNMFSKNGHGGFSKNMGEDDDDWEREMFGDDTIMKRNDMSHKEAGGLSNNLLEVKRTISDNLLTHENRSNRSKKNITNHKQSEMFASREDAYTEWEDL